ncbi:N4-gp56 family major capsid protein [Candidatus Pacearchaeota archaeon]|nr:N4-gp56 family major capsid protein [Candidatus Pacearchaeota archaeon]
MAPLASSDIPAHVPLLYGVMILKQALQDTFWNLFTGPEGSGMPIIQKTDLTSSPGDRIRIHTVKKLTGAGVTGNTTLRGTEENLGFDYQDVIVDQLRHATSHYRMTNKQSIYDLANLSKVALADWLAGKLDDDMFTTLTTSPDHIIYGGNATGINDIDATDKLTTTVISKARVKAKQLLIKPAFTINGQSYYGMVVDEFQAYDLKGDTVWQQANREAMPRGDENRLFTGALGHWDGVVLFENARVPRAANTNSPAVNVAKAVLFGSGAAVNALGEPPLWVPEEFDYGNEWGTSIAIVYGEEKCTLDNVDTGLINVLTAATDPNA